MQNVVTVLTDSVQFCINYTPNSSFQFHSNLQLTTKMCGSCFWLSVAVDLV